MHVVALPGRRIETEAWLRSLLVAAGFPESDVIRYRHWVTDAEASVAFEAECLAKQSPEFVIAKSLGTVIAATAFCLHEFRPTAAVLIGTPYSAIESSDLQLLQRFAAGVETLFIQQTEDPGGSAARLHTALNVSSNDVAAVPGDDHLYSDTAALVAIIQRWKKQQADD
jgi:hypothetical protein